VAENTPTGKIILHVQAVDRDAGSNGLVEYLFAPQTQSSYGQLFGIRNGTGEIYVRGSIDHEVASVYQVRIWIYPSTTERR